jgi:S-(hydroxymethyl)glutathione dehydrogenase/alcohol dehydrogenase
MPTILGHEVAGIVEAVGPDVTYVKPGDHVIGCAGGPCYTCRYCVTGTPIVCEGRDHDRRPGEPPRLSQGGSAINQYGQLSAFAQQMLIHENATVRIRPDMPLELASIVGCGVATGLGAVFNTAKVTPGASVAVVGCGGVGLNVVQGARVAGATEIVAIDLLDGKLDRARAFGATTTIKASSADVVEAVKERTEGRGVGFAFDVTGNKAAMEEAVRMLAPRGTLTLVGMPPEDATMEFVPAKLIPAEQRIIGTSVGSLRPRFDIPRYIDMYLAGQIELERLVSRRIALEAINEGFDAMNQGDVARSIVVFS